MQNVSNTSTKLTFKVGKAAKKAKYFIDIIGFSKSSVEVDYTLNNDCLQASINFTSLINFALNGTCYSHEAANKYDFMGELMKDIYELTGAYLAFYKIGQIPTPVFN